MFDYALSHVAELSEVRSADSTSTTTQRTLPGVRSTLETNGHQQHTCARYLVYSSHFEFTMQFHPANHVGLAGRVGVVERRRQRQWRGRSRVVDMATGPGILPPVPCPHPPPHTHPRTAPRLRSPTLCRGLCALAARWRTRASACVDVVTLVVDA